MPKVTDLADIGTIEANDIIYVVDGATGVSKKGTISNLPSNPPAGSNGDFQYNDAGSLGAAPMDYNDTRANAISVSAPLYVDHTITAQAVTDDDRQIIVKNSAGTITASIRGNGNVQGLTGIFANLQSGDTLVSNIEVVGSLESATAVIGSCASPDTSAALNVCANPVGGVNISSASVPAVDGHYTENGTINGYTKYLQDDGTYYLFVCLSGSGGYAVSWAIDTNTGAYYNAVKFQQSTPNLADPFNAYYLNPLNVSETASVQDAGTTTKAANFDGDVVVDGEVSAVDVTASGTMTALDLAAESLHLTASNNRPFSIVEDSYGSAPIFVLGGGAPFVFDAPFQMKNGESFSGVGAIYNKPVYQKDGTTWEGSQSYITFNSDGSVTLVPKTNAGVQLGYLGLSENATLMGNSTASITAGGQGVSVGSSGVMLPNIVSEIEKTNLIITDSGLSVSGAVAIAHKTGFTKTNSANWGLWFENDGSTHLTATQSASLYLGTKSGGNAITISPASISVSKDITSTGNISAVDGVFSGSLSAQSGFMQTSSSSNGMLHLLRGTSIAETPLGGWALGAYTLDGSGIAVAVKDATVTRTGYALYTRTGIGSLSQKFKVDTEGDAYFSGDISAVDGVFSGQIKPSTMPTTAGGAGNYRLYCAGVGQPVYWG